MSKGKGRSKIVPPKLLALQSQLRRDRGERNIEKRILIVCEDEKSAPNYFYALKKYLNLSAASIEVAGSGGNTQPMQVVKKAADLRGRSFRDDSGTMPFNSVWALVDGDYGKKVGVARIEAKKNGVNLVVTTQCFEYWVVLHYEDYQSPDNKCDDVVRYLKKHDSMYSKGACNFKDIVSKYTIASNRAKTLREPQAERCLPENQNPCSEIYKLINHIEEKVVEIEEEGGWLTQPRPQLNPLPSKAVRNPVRLTLTSSAATKHPPESQSRT